MVVLVTQLLAWTPVTTAATLPPARTALVASGGFTVLRVDLPSLPVFPVLTGDVELGRGLGRHVDVRLRYSTHLGFIHRLGPELRVTATRTNQWSLGARINATAQFAGSAQDGVEYGGDVATLAGLLATYRWATGALTLDAAVAIDWLVYERFNGHTTLDDRAYLAAYDLGLTFEWPVSRTQNLMVRLEAHVPTGPDDPSTVGGVVPRVVFGGAFYLGE